MRGSTLTQEREGARDWKANETKRWKAKNKGNNSTPHWAAAVRQRRR